MQVADDLIQYLDRTPQPVAQALGRVVRASGQSERLEACLKAAEVVTRYLAVIGLASAAARRHPAVPSLRVERFSGNLSFGHFEAATRAVFVADWEHPLRSLFREHLRPTAKKHKGLAHTAVQVLIALRNQLGHALTPADEHRAGTIFADVDPIGRLVELLEGTGPILRLPLVAALAQDYRKGRFQARLAFYVGEGEPIPRQVTLRVGLFEWESPYLCTEDGLLPLAGGLLLHPRKDGRLGLHLLDAINPTVARYKSTYDNAVVETDRFLLDLSRWVELPFEPSPVGQPSPLLEEINVEDGRSLLGFVRGDPVPAECVGAQGEPAQAGNLIGNVVASVREFEEQANLAGVGFAYRDVLYSLLELENKVELGDGGTRIVSGADGRVLVTAQLRAGPELVLTIWPGGFQNGFESEPLVFSTRPGQSADEILSILTKLTTPPSQALSESADA